MDIDDRITSRVSGIVEPVNIYENEILNCFNGKKHYWHTKRNEHWCIQYYIPFNRQWFTVSLKSYDTYCKENWQNEWNLITFSSKESS